MKFKSTPVMVSAVAMAVAFVLPVTPLGAQAAPQEKPQMADDIFKNVQVLKGLTVDEFMGIATASRPRATSRSMPSTHPSSKPRAR